MRSIVIGTAGHIDHGKSALVKALTGTDPDRLKEEQARGITIDLGFAHTDIDGVHVALVDVPGHERFVRNMLAGAGGIDAVVLVIAANESIMPQTREHFAICRLLGVDRGVVVLSKADVVDAETIELVTLEVHDLVAGSFLASAPIVAVSSRTGTGLDRLRHTLAGLAGGPARQARHGCARLPVDRVFSVKGFGTVVTGTLVSGQVALGDELAVLPEGDVVRVRGVQVHGESVDVAHASGRVAINIGSSATRLARGVTLATPDSLAVTRRFDAHIELLTDSRPLRHGARVRVHQGTLDVLGRVAIAAVRTTPTSEWRPARIGEAAVILPPGGEAFVRLRLDRAAALTRDDRVVLRALSPSVTLGGGRVLDPLAPMMGLRRATSLERFLELDSDGDGAPSPSLEAQRVKTGFADLWLRESAGAGLEPAMLVQRGGLDREASVRVLDRLVREGRAILVTARYFDRACVAMIESRVVEDLRAAHRADPQSAGMSRESLRQRRASAVADGLFAHIVAGLAARGIVSGTDRLALSSHRPEVSRNDLAATVAAERALRASGLTPPETTTLAASLGVAVPELERALRQLCRERQVVRIGDLHFHVDVLAMLKRDVAGLKAAPTGGTSAGVRVDVAMFKARFVLTRKHAIPLLEYLDRERITRRVGDERIVL